jgi:hypothetical protein
LLLVGANLGQGIQILVDSDATHNIIDSSIARIIDLTERRINTTVLVGSSIELAY